MKTLNHHAYLAVVEEREQEKFLEDDGRCGARRDKTRKATQNAQEMSPGACRSIRRKRKFQWRRPSKEDEQKNRRRSHSYVDGFFAKSDEAGRMPMKFAAGEYSDRLLGRRVL